MNELKEAVANFKDYTSGHGYVLRTLAEQVIAGKWVRKPSREEIRGASARGYCTKRNEKKELDVYLLEDVADAIFELLEKDGG